MGGLGSWVFASHSGRLAHLGGAHSRAHHASAGGGAWSGFGHVGILLLELDPLDVLRVFNFLFDVLVSLEQLVVFGLTELETLVKVGLQLLLECVHLILLLLDQLGFSSDDLLVSLLHVLLSFDDFKFLSLLLHLMGLSVFLLLGQRGLDFLEVQ